MLVSPEYTKGGGVYASVVPIGWAPQLLSELAVAEHGYEACTISELHATICYDARAVVSREAIVAFAAANHYSPTTVFDAFAVPTPQHWVNSGKLYIGVELFSTELQALRENIMSGLGVSSDFATFKCHVTLGKFRGLSEEVLADMSARTQIIDRYWGKTTAFPGKVGFTGLRFTNVKS